MALKEQKIQGLILFSQINKLGSLSAAAQSLGISRSSVSKQLAALERVIGSRLFNRTTRKLVLTQVGKQVLVEAQKVQRSLLTIEHISEDSQSVIAGELNVTSASAQGRVHLLPLIIQFLTLYPNINIKLQLDDQFVDLIEQNIDVAIRIGYLPDSTLIARKIGELKGILCATSNYLNNAPPLKTPRDLLNHQCLFYRNASASMNNWAFVKDGKEEIVTVSGSLSINDPIALIEAALKHAGVLLIDRSLLVETIGLEKLVNVLPDYQVASSLPIYLVYPEKEFIPAKTRALVDFLAEKMPPLLRGE